MPAKYSIHRGYAQNIGNRALTSCPAETSMWCADADSIKRRFAVPAPSLGSAEEADGIAKIEWE